MYLCVRLKLQRRVQSCVEVVDAAELPNRPPGLPLGPVDRKRLNNSGPPGLQ